MWTRSQTIPIASRRPRRAPRRARPSPPRGRPPPRAARRPRRKRPREVRRQGDTRVRGSGSAKLAKLANFWRARSRLYQNEILQENMRLTAFFKLYKTCILFHRCNLKIFAKNRCEKSAIFVKFQQNFANFANFAKLKKNNKILPNFKNFSLMIW